MPLNSTEQFLAYVSEKLPELASNAGAFLQSAKQYVHQQYGQTGVTAMFIVGASVSVVLLGKLIKLAFAILKFVILPAVILSFIAVAVFDTTFANSFPIAAALCSVFLIFKS